MASNKLTTMQNNLQSQKNELQIGVSTYKDVMFKMVSAVSKKLGDPSLLTSLEGCTSTGDSLTPATGLIPVDATALSVENLLAKDDSSLTDDDLRTICRHALVMVQKTSVWETKISQIESELEVLRARIEADEQYSKNYDVLLHNFPDVPTNKYNSAFSKWAVNELNENLPSLEPKLRISDIDTSHTFKTRNKNTNPMAIVRFCSRDTKRRVLKCKSDLKKLRYGGKPLSLTEHLTNKNLELFKDAQAHYGFTKVWTDNCVILAEGKDKKAMRVKRSAVPPRPTAHDPSHRAPQAVAGSSTSSN